MAEHTLTFPVLSDPGNEIAHAFGLRHGFPEDLKKVYQDFGIDLAIANGDPSWTLPMPARYVVDADGVIVHRDVNADYTRRPEPIATLEVVRRLG